MAYVLFQEASCEGALSQTSRSYRIVLSTTENPGYINSDLKSTYASVKSSASNNKCLWDKPFGGKIPFVRLPPQLTVTLREGRWPRHGRDLVKYTLDCASNCSARSFVLSPLSGNNEPNITIRLVVTISGNPANRQQNAQEGSAAEPLSKSLPTETQNSTPESQNPAASVIPSDPAILQAEAENDLANASASLTLVNPRVAQYLDALPSTLPPGAADATKGLTSVLSNLEGIIKVADLLADVHPLVKGAWSLVSAAYQVARAQADLDESVEALIDAMDDGCKLAKDYAPLNGHYAHNDSVVRDILREVIKGANVIKVYCEKRPKKLSAIRTLASDLSQEVDGCSQALSKSKQQLLSRITLRSLVQVEHMVDLMDRSAADKDLHELRYAADANRVLRDGSRGCLFGTRIELTDAVRDWSGDAPPQDGRAQYLDALDPESRVLWLCGVAGAGKSSIVISVAKVLWEMGLLGSLYSFQAAKQATLNPTNLFSTIACHLAQHNSTRRQRLIEIIRDSNAITRATSSPTDQFEKFLLPLLAHNDDETVVEPTVIIIDAFDECSNIAGRKELLNILTQRAHELPAGVRIIITSRYEVDVQEALESQPQKLCVLKMEHIPKDSTEHDIDVYVHEALKDVHGVDAEQFVPELTKLALAAEQSFQWASTACLFIQNEDDGDGASDPLERLAQVLQTKEGLDDLYRTVLDRHFGASQPEALKPLLDLLGCLACAREPLCLHAITSLGADLSTSLNLSPKKYHRLALKLSSLVTGTQDLETPLIALHTSFTDFLRDKNRSQRYFVDTLRFHERLATRCLGIMAKGLRFNICNLPTSFQANDEIENIKQLIHDYISDILSYACRFWTYHLSKLGEWTESEVLNDSVSALLRDRVLEWLEVMSLTGSSPLDALGYLESIDQPPLLAALLQEASQFVAYFGAPIMKSAAHIYLSALPFTPTSSPLRDLLSTFRGTVRVTSGELATWPKIRHVLEGHQSAVTSLAFSPVGDLIASGSRDGIIYLWNRTEGVLDAVLEGHGEHVRSLSFSPNGTLLVSGSDDRTVRIWDVKAHTANGAPLVGHTDWVQSVVFSPDGKLIASGSDDKTIRIWDVRTRAAVKEPLVGHGHYVRSVAFSPDGTLVASGSNDKTVRIWDIRSHAAVGGPLKGHVAQVRSVAFSSDGTIIASGSSDRTIRIWDVRSCSTIGDPLLDHTSGVELVAFSPTSNLVASGSADGTVRVWDVTLRVPVDEPLETHSSGMNAVAFSLDGKLVASSSGDKSIRIWAVGSRNAVGESLSGHVDNVQSVAFSPDSSLIASSSADKTIRMWDAGSYAPIGEPLEGHSRFVRSVAFSPDGTLIASGSEDHTIRIWDVRSRTTIGGPLKGHTDYVQSVAFSPDGSLLASGSDDKTIRIWNVTLRTAVGEPLKGHTRYIRSVAFSPGGALLASSSDDKTIRIWDVASRTPVGKPLKGHTHYVLSVAFSPDGTLLASGSADPAIRIWDVASRTPVGEPLEGHSAWVRSVAFSPDGTILASGSADKTIRIWDVASHTVVGEPLEGHTDLVRSIAFSPNGTFIASGSLDRTVRLWDVRVLGSIVNHSSEVTKTALSPLHETMSPPTPRQLSPHFSLSLLSMRRLKDGWIVGPQGELVLWIPPAIGLASVNTEWLPYSEIHTSIIPYSTLTTWSVAPTGRDVVRVVRWIVLCNLNPTSLNQK